MKKFVAILFCTLLPLCALHSGDKDNITAKYLQTREGPWACLEGKLDRENQNITLALGKNEKNAILEMAKDKYYLISRADSIFVSGEYLRIDLVSKDDACLLNKEQAKEITKIDGGGTNTTLPRPVALKRETGDNNNEWIFDLQINDTKRKSRRVVILRDWPHACPACSLVFSTADNKESIFVASGDTSYIYRNSEDPLILSSIKVTKDKKGKFIRIDKIIINGKDGEISYKTKESQEEVTKDAYTLDCYAEISVGEKVQNIESIQVEYSYLDENLNEVPDTIDIRPDIETPQPPRRSSLPPINWEAIICCLLFVLTLLASGTLIWLLRAKNEAPKSPGPDNDGPVSASRQTQANHSEQILAGEQRQKQAAAEAQQQAMLNELKQEKNALTQENESLRKENNDLQAKNSELQANYSGLQANHNELQASYSDLQAKNSELQARISILQASYDDLQANYKQKASLLIEAAQKAFGEMPEDAKLTDFITQKGEEFKGLLCELEQLAQQMEAENAKHKAELERLWEEFKKKHQELIAAHQEDTRLYRDAQLALLNQMKAAYERCSGGAIPSSKFGKYVLSISESLSSFVKTGKTLFQEATDEDSIASLSEKFSPTLRKALNDHTSWLNALVGLEAYARTEVLRKPMLEDGLDLSSLTEFFYATQELLNSNFYTINPLPALFVDTAPGDDYIRDNMDSKISNLFDYEKVLKTSAIVDIIKIGYSYKNSAPTQTTINYYEKPREI